MYPFSWPHSHYHIIMVKKKGGNAFASHNRGYALPTSHRVFAILRPESGMKFDGMRPNHKTNIDDNFLMVCGWNRSSSTHPSNK